MTVASFCARELLRPLLERCETNISIFTTQALQKCWWQLLCCFILIHSGLALGGKGFRVFCFCGLYLDGFQRPRA